MSSFFVSSFVHSGSFASLARGMLRCAVLGCVLAISACATKPTARVFAPKYPEDVARTQTLDVQVKREGTQIRVINTSSRTLGPGRMWINMRFSRDVDSLAPSQELELDLREFRDDLGDVFRAGGFFSKEKPDAVVLVQWQTDNQMLGLVAVAEEAR